jgi:hypothetical protein
MDTMGPGMASSATANQAAAVDKQHFRLQSRFVGLPNAPLEQGLFL